MTALSQFKMVYITFPTREKAKKLARLLLESKLVACCNIFSVESLYWWKDRIEKTKEFVLIAKTLAHKINKLVELIKKNHPYSVPFIGILNVSVNKDYCKWVKSVLK
ncbi:MAG: divalent-cation tolerance protein CutA [Candidatus Aenigmarchaeota archaeon]|nr:divalent-cation tolerance protein CutA [Candidatus Aenigmarchaeota archaeon]